MWNLADDGAMVSPIPDDRERQWELNVISVFSGTPTQIVPAQLVATNEELGTTVSYGLGRAPEEFDRWTIREPNGGGAVIVPHVLVDNELYVGAIRQFRSLTGGYQMGLVRGFSTSSETHEGAAKRELGEESGAAQALVERIYPFGGKKVNPNSTYFQANPHQNEGVAFFGLPLDLGEVVPRRTAPDARRRVFVLRPDLVEQIQEVNEKISPTGLRFFHVDLLQNTSDGFTLIGLGKLLGTLHRCR